MGQPEREIQLQGEEDEMVISCCVIGEQAGLSFRCATPCRYLGYNCSRVMQQRRVNWYTCTVHAMINAFRMNLGVKSFFFFFFSDTMKESDILFYMAIFFFNFVKIHSFLELYINIRIIWRIDSSRQIFVIFVQNKYKNRWELQLLNGY